MELGVSSNSVCWSFPNVLEQNLTTSTNSSDGYDRIPHRTDYVVHHSFWNFDCVGRVSIDVKDLYLIIAATGSVRET